jgi:phage-related protein
MPAEIHWEGDSKEVLSAFPSDVKMNFGYNLRRLQNGLQPVCDTRSLPSIGKGVYELKDADERTWYRVMYLSKIDDVIYVLHSFEKDTRKTTRRDITVAQERLKAVRRRIQEAKREKRSE